MLDRKHTVRILIGAITVACVGLIAVQIRLLLNMADLKREVFDRSVASALTQASTTLDHLDVADRFFFVQDTVHKPAGSAGNWITRSGDSSMQMSVLSTDSGTVTSRFSRGMLSYSVDRPLSITVEAFDDRGQLDTVLVREQTVESDGTVSVPGAGYRGAIAFIRLRSGEGTATFRLKDGFPQSSVSIGAADTSKREYMVRRVIESFDAVRTPPVRSVDGTTLDSVITDALRDHAIATPFSAGILRGDSLTVVTDSSRAEDVRASTYAVPLGPQMPFTQNDRLSVSFHSPTGYVLSEMRTDLLLSVLLIGVIIVTFVSSLRALIRQGEFAGRLRDFINNMTHEFKTPVSTIGLASEALDRPDVVRSAKKVKTYNAVIRDENLRMRGQIDRILQMATLEEGEVDFRKERIATHSILARAVEAARLHVTARGGLITTDLRAGKDVVLGDALHLEGVVHNILDNAMKYSPDAPDISVTTALEDGSIVVRVGDKGIGIPQASLSSVFDKFYRVPTGNLHDVKGFGLGLSYVKLVVEKHGGSVRLTSERPGGTIVEIRLPVMHEA